jgi:folate-binding protein YgfZ
MEKNQIVVLDDRGIISVSGLDSGNFLQNILTNDIDKVIKSNTIFSAIFTPQGKYLYEFFVIKSKNGYFLDCDNEFTKEIVDHLLKYKLRSKVEIKDITSKYVVGAISLEKFEEIQNSEKINTQTVPYKGSLVFLDPRKKKLGARILSAIEKLHLTVKILNLKIIDNKIYYNEAHIYGIPIKGIKELKNQLFGLEANLEQFKAIDFKKGCYVGQENTARMKLKNKLRRKLMPVKTEDKTKIGDEIMFNNIKVGKILINDPYPFALINLFDPEFSKFKDKELSVENKTVKILL